jgi:four helix bundle protein
LDKKQRTDFRGLEVWQKCKAIRKQIWSLTRKFPGEEKYRLGDQMIRATRSATACIAEGHGRFHFKENIQFCRQARGSLYELVDHIDTAAECGYIENHYCNTLSEETQTAIKVLNGYIRYLKEKKISTGIR